VQWTKRREGLIAHRAILAVIPVTLGLLLSGCGQEAPPPKPPGSVVQKKIQKPEEAAKPPATQKPAQEKPAGSPQEAPKQAQAQQAAEPPAGSSPEAAKTEVSYSYEPGDRPDPFRPFHEEAKAAAPAGECDDVPPGPLTEQEVSQFVLVAVVGQGADRVAMVQDRSGKGYLIRQGLYMGRKCGKVTDINPTEGVVVEEPFVDLLGQKQTRRVILGFKKSQGGGR
jgi:type IV pilus assembly protein PilP